MKGFPNQVADLAKLATAMQCIVQLTDAGEDARDDGVLGEALVRSGVAGPGHSPQPIEDYLLSQRAKKTSNQSHRATARGLLELFEILGFINDSGEAVEITDLGRQAATFASLPLDEKQVSFWRRAIRNMSHDGGDGQESHPYQVLLRLIASRPGIEKPKCALALEARNDSPEELARIVALSDLPEGRIRSGLRSSRTGTRVSESNWENAVKVLPRLGEQLADVVRTGHRGYYRYQIADAPGQADTVGGVAPTAREPRTRRAGERSAGPKRTTPRPPRTSRSVTPETVGQAATLENFDEADVKTQADPVVTRRLRLDRLRRHELMVRALAARLAEAHAELSVDPFDLLAILAEIAIMVEVKTLDGTVEDERARVREALAQLLYYPAFLVSPLVNEDSIEKIACFERKISNAHIRWLNSNNIAVIWKEGDGFAGDALAVRFLRRYLRELR